MFQSAFCMKQEQDYIQDIAAIRSMMERSSKFLSLSGWSGVLAGVYALIGVGVVYFIGFNPLDHSYNGPQVFNTTILVAVVVLFLAISTAIFFSKRKALKNNQSLWNRTSKQMLLSMAVPLITGGAFMLIMLSQKSFWTLIPLSMIFYGVSLFSAGAFTFREIRILGIIQIILGLVALSATEYSLLLWALGFGVMHIIYGAYIHFKYER